MHETAGDIFKRIAFKGTLLTAAFGVVHLAELATNFMTDKKADNVSEVEILFADDDLILRHGSRAWGAYLGLKGSAEVVASDTEVAAQKLQSRILSVVDAETADIAEKSMDLGQTEFADGKWSQESLLAYTDSIIDIDKSMREGALAQALSDQGVPLNAVMKTARVVSTMDAVWNASADSFPNYDFGYVSLMINDAQGDALKIVRTEAISAALDVISSSQRHMEFLAPRDSLRIKISHDEDKPESLEF